MVLQNIVGYVGQLDDHAPFLTVQETFDFAANCRLGMKNQEKHSIKHYTASTRAPSLDMLSENLTVDGLDLAVCRDTYVGDANHRGVSGGQRRRVTVGEMSELVYCLWRSYYLSLVECALLTPHSLNSGGTVPCGVRR